MEARPAGSTRGLDNDANVDDNGKGQSLGAVHEFDDMYAYLSGNLVVFDDVKYNNDSDFAVLAAVVKGVAISEICSPERVTKLCKKYHLVPGGSLT